MNNIYANTKKVLKKGSFYIYKENKNTLDEINITLNYLKAKNINIVKINDLLN